MRPTLDAYLMSLAMVASERTTCIKRAVGCVLADAKGRVLSIAYNGVASGVPHCNDKVECKHKFPGKPSQYSVADLRTRVANDQGLKLEQMNHPHIVGDGAGHAVLVFGHHPHACEGHHLPSGQDSCEAVHAEQNAILQCSDPDLIATAYVTTSPCKPCMKLLLNTGCRRIVFHEEHTDPWPKEQWLKAGRLWEKL